MLDTRPLAQDPPSAAVARVRAQEPADIWDAATVAGITAVSLVTMEAIALAGAASLSQHSPAWWWLMAAPVVGCGAALAALWGHRRWRRRRRAQLSAFAESMGGTHRLIRRDFIFDGMLRTLGRDARFEPAVELDDEFRTFVATVRWKPNEDERDASGTLTCATFTLPFFVPNIFVRPRWWGHRSGLPFSYSRHARVSMGHPADDAIIVLAPADYRTDLFQLMPPHVLDALVRCGRTRDIELRGRQVTVYFGRESLHRAALWREIDAIREEFIRPLARLRYLDRYQAPKEPYSTDLAQSTPIGPGGRSLERSYWLTNVVETVGCVYLVVKVVPAIWNFFFGP